MTLYHQLNVGFMEFSDGNFQFLPRYFVVSATLKLITGFKQEIPSLKVILSLGGHGGDSGVFAYVTRNNLNRFIKSIIKYIRRHNMDGLNVYWKPPSQNKGLFTKFVQVRCLLSHVTCINNNLCKGVGMGAT